MGREVRRVALGFRWPLHQVWDGYVNPYDEDEPEKFNAWFPIEPPEGDGWQVWETVSDGSPISPVCGTPEELAQWLVDNRASTFGSETASYETWLKFITGPGWAPSMIMTESRLISGVDAVVNADDDER